MKFKNSTILLVCIIVALSIPAALAGIFSNSGPGEYLYTSIRGQIIHIYGKGVYQHMSSDVAVQGIAQDYITLFMAIPLLLISALLTIRGSIRAKFVFIGTLGYFLVTYLFYMCMAMYNELFMIYVLLTSASFYAFLLNVVSFNLKNFNLNFNSDGLRRFAGGFLIFTAATIALMWLGIIIPPMLNNKLYPLGVQHYTTLIVQGMDLSILLPAAFLSGLLLIKKRPIGYFLAPVYLVFLSILMTALSAKIVGMTLVGVNAGPALIIIPVFNLLTIISMVLCIKNLQSAQ